MPVLENLPVDQRMEVLLRQMEQQGDRRAVFLNCYLLMTRNMLSAIQSGDFNDPQWVSGLLHNFAEYYFRAYQAYDTADVLTPPVWRLAFDSARQPGTNTLRQLLLGINAHINYDLCFALEDALRPEWALLSSQQLEQRHADHQLINQIIADTVNLVQDTVIERYDPLLDLVDRLLGPVDEWLAARMIRVWRESVWEYATHLATCTDPEDRKRTLAEIEQSSLHRAEILMGERLPGSLDDIFK
jgi:hypothetical protein